MHATPASLRAGAVATPQLEARAADGEPAAKRPRLDESGPLSPRPASPSVADTLPPRQGVAALADAHDRLRGPDFDRALAARRHPALAGYLNELESAYRENRTPNVNDTEHLGELIAGLNKADPGLRLDLDVVMMFEPNDVVADYRLTQQLERGLSQGGDFRFVIDDQDVDHRYAMGVHCDPASRSASLILVDAGDESSETAARMEAWRDILDRIGQVLRDRLPGDPPVRLHLAVASTTVQRTSEGCGIFALSAARKLASEPSIAGLHRATLLNLACSDATTVVTPLPSTDLPASFFKHATSGNDMLDHLFRRDESARARQLDGVFNPVVNRQGHTLLERWASHLTSRRDEGAGKQRIYSNSYEAKRIELIRTALAHLVRPGA